MEATLSGLIRLLRYRFLLFAGLLPYVLGAAVAFHIQGEFSLFFFFTGLLGLFFVLLAVEALNEFFDWRLGTDRVFQLDPKPVTIGTFLFGLASLVVALIVAVFLTWKLGLPILVFSLLGFFSVLFYLGPPIKLAYRGLGELVIALSYGPFMMMGSYYLQTQSVDGLPIFVSVIPALQLFVIAAMNEVPDYLQDRLVGKANLCVRLGQKKVLELCGIALVIFYLILLVGLFKGAFPRLTAAGLAALPLSFLSYTIGLRTYENPQHFISAIRYLIVQYVFILGVFIVAYLAEGHFSST